MATSYLFKILIIIFLEEEWNDNIPFIPNSESGKKKIRSLFLVLMVLSHTDYFYWLYIIYYKSWRDGAVEHMTSLFRTIAFFFEFAPIFLFCLYYELSVKSN